MNGVHVYAFFTLLQIQLFSVLCKTDNEILESGLEKDDIKHILEMHNDYRLQLVKGKTPGQVKACDMKKLKWDKILAAKAQNISDKCTFAHVIVNDERWDHVGQNLGIEAYSYDRKERNWTLIINMWHDEHKKYNYPDNPTQHTGHYTQLVWAKTESIGCGYTYFKSDTNLYEKLYVCNYGPAGNRLGSPPYETKGSECNKLT